jgi:uncharacterized protein YhfF
MPEFELMELGSPGPLRDRLVSAVVGGEKTATSSLLVQYEQAGEPLPQPGTRKHLVDSDEETVGVVELVAVQLVRLGEVDLGVALDEGEGFGSVAEWREAHEEFWRKEILPDLGLPDSWLNDDTMVVVERFRHVAAPVDTRKPADDAGRLSHSR